jgi:hypothetical protein
MDGSPAQQRAMQQEGLRRVDSTAAAIQRIQKEREDRRRSAEFVKRERKAELAKIEASGMPIADVDFQRMISRWRDENGDVVRPHDPPGDHNICVVVRKRPINPRELAARDWDSVCTMHICGRSVDLVTISFNYRFVFLPLLLCVSCR